MLENCIVVSNPIQAALFDVTIDDLTETPTAKVNGNPVTLLPDSSGEFIHFTMRFSFSAELVTPDTTPT